MDVSVRKITLKIRVDTISIRFLSVNSVNIRTKIVCYQFLHVNLSIKCVQNTL